MDPREFLKKAQVELDEAKSALQTVEGFFSRRGMEVNVASQQKATAQSPKPALAPANPPATPSVRVAPPLKPAPARTISERVVLERREQEKTSMSPSERLVQLLSRDDFENVAGKIRKFIPEVLKEELSGEVWGLLISRIQEYPSLLTVAADEVFFSKCPKEGLLDLLFGKVLMGRKIVSSAMTTPRFEPYNLRNLGIVFQAGMVIPEEARVSVLLHDAKEAVERFVRMGLREDHWLAVMAAGVVLQADLPAEDATPQKPAPRRRRRTVVEMAKTLRNEATPEDIVAWEEEKNLLAQNGGGVMAAAFEKAEVGSSVQ